MWITEAQLDEWVRGNSRIAQGVIVELVARLVAASCPSPRDRRFPRGDSIGQHGADGYLDIELGLDPFVPDGVSFWEIGTSLDAGDKATSDYRDRTKAVPEDDRKDATFVFVTPLSSLRDWKDTWKEGQQRDWLQERRGCNDWKAVRVIDGTRLNEWIREFHSVNAWLIQQTVGPVAADLDTVGQRWDIISSIGDPPPLPPQIFLVNREGAREKLDQVLADKTKHLKLDTPYTDQVVGFVSAHVAELSEASRLDAEGRCVIVSSSAAWNAVVAQRQRHILIADSMLDLAGEAGTILIQKAHRGGHAVIFRGDPGGIPDPSRAALPAPKIGQIQDALEKAGYSSERARTLAAKSGGILGSLLRCIQNLSLHPSWAETSAASDLVIAELLGSWVETSEGDKAIVENLSGNSYGEWIGRVREIALGPDTPLVQQDGHWRFVARFEGWYALGPRLYDEHLERLQKAATDVLSENDPVLDLAKEERFAASIYGKARKFSKRLRMGLAEALALVGSRDEALTNCSFGKAEATAVLTIRALLSEASAIKWASLNDVLPLLAEAAPQEFLGRLQDAIDADNSVFRDVFAEEGDGIMSRSYSTGVLWALETLAWAPEYLNQAAMCLGGLAAIDPGGMISNRPANSLRTILLPWLPQTLAPVSQRRSAAATLLSEYPDVGWKLLLALLPEVHSASGYTRRPAWRPIIPDDWTAGTTHAEYWEQVTAYADLAFEAAAQDPAKMRQLMDHWENLPKATGEKILSYLRSDEIKSLPEEARHQLWSGLVAVIDKHRRFADAAWAIGSGRLAELEEVATALDPGAPSMRHQRLFSENVLTLLDRGEDYQELYRKLEERRSQAVAEIADSGGLKAVLEFATAVEAPWQVGAALGRVAPPKVDVDVLPDLLESPQQAIAKLAGAFVMARFQDQRWPWVNGVIASIWSVEQIALFLSFLPFNREVWDHASRLLGENIGAYWKKAAVNPFQVEPPDLLFAAQQLTDHGRPVAAIQCLSQVVHKKDRFDPSLAVRALLEALNTHDGSRTPPEYETIEVIKALQEDSRTAPEDLFRVEWAFLPLLHGYHGATPQALEDRLATDPAFFSEVIRLAFRSKHTAPTNDESEDSSHWAIVMNGYRLLNEWHTPPGSVAHGGYDGDRLAQWLETAKQQTESTGHLEVAMIMVGRVLAHAPADPGGLWIHQAVARALNAKDASDLRDGFRNEILNSRGAHWVDPTGKAEAALADKYRLQAQDVDTAGYPRLAVTMREIVASYEREGERVRREEQGGI